MRDMCSPMKPPAFGSCFYVGGLRPQGPARRENTSKNSGGFYPYTKIFVTDLPLQKQPKTLCCVLSSVNLFLHKKVCKKCFVV